MIDFYFWTTPNGYKVLVFLEETGIPYRIIPVNISKGEGRSQSAHHSTENHTRTGCELWTGKGEGAFELTTYSELVLQVVRYSASAITEGSATAEIQYRVICKE